MLTYVINVFSKVLVFVYLQNMRLKPLIKGDSQVWGFAELTQQL